MVGIANITGVYISNIEYPIIVKTIPTVVNTEPDKLKSFNILRFLTTFANNNNVPTVNIIFASVNIFSAFIQLTSKNIG